MDFVIFLAGLALTVGTLLRLQKKINAEHAEAEQAQAEQAENMSADLLENRNPRQGADAP